MFDRHVAFQARLKPRATAVITNRRRVTYAEFEADIARLAAGLWDLGLAPGQVVSLKIENGYLQYAIPMALARIGVPTSPGNDPAADLSLTEAPPSDGATDPNLLRLEPDWLKAVLAAEPRPLDLPPLDPDATGRVMLSSGTTRAPRRVAMPWRRIEASLTAVIQAYGHDKAGVWIPLTSLEAMMGFTQALAAWAIGAPVLNGIQAVDLPPWLETLEPGLIGLTPIQLRAILGRLPDGFTPRPGWRILVGGSALPLPVARETGLRLTPDVRVIYGCTETTLTATGMARDLEEHPSMIGYAPPSSEVDIVDDAGERQPPGEVGEMRIRGDRTADGYLGDPQATAEHFRDGWFYTGDLARKLADGLIVLEGRADDRMNLGGLKVMPGPLEAAAHACPGVLDCAAFAAPDKLGLDQCWLAVVTAPGFDRESLARHMADHPDLPATHFAWIEEIPRNTMGKIERTKLRDALVAALSP